MEQVTPNDLLWIAGMVAVVTGSAFVAGYWPEISAVFHRYVNIRRNADADNEAGSGELVRRFGASSPGSDAVNGGSQGGTGSASGVRRMSDAELIALLAVQRDDQNKHRFSANKIAALVGGTREDVLDQIRAVRNLPDYQPLTPEQQEAREWMEA